LTALFTQGAASEVKSLAIDIPGLLGSTTAYVGFTGATGGASATQEILNWTFDQGVPPAAVTGLQAQVTGYTATSTGGVPLGAHLTWDAAGGAASYKIERKLTAAGTYQQIGTSTMTSFDDTGLTPGSNYFYRVRATNAVGDGGYSSDVPLTTPSLPPTATNAQAITITTTSIAFRFTDNANNEDGFQIYRSINGGLFSLLAALPVNSIPAPSLVTFTDNGLTPGNHYDYHALAFNLAGYSDFAGLSTQTLTVAPTNLAASATPGAVALSWTAPFGAVSYNVYRSTTPGGQGATPYATGIATTNFSDSGLVPGTTYYYKVTAVDLGGESARSNEAFVAPPRVSSVQIDDGGAQRSRVASLTVVFNTRVNVTAASFSITGFTGTISVDTSQSTSTQTIAKLTFSGGGVIGGSLADGNYQLNVLSAQVTDLVGQFLDGDNDGQQGGDAHQAFFRFYGDINGDRHVDIADFGVFSGTFNLHAGQAGFLTYLDYNNDGVIDILDFGQFSLRIFTTLP
jgi:fibronectin type 3 domain-containing protein